jgi:hypothetical protein
MSMMVTVVKRYFEWILIGLAAVSLLLAFGQVRVAPLLMIMSFLILAFYYLLSATLVLTDKRVSRGMRLIFVVGLYMVSIGLVGSLFKLSLWRGSETLLVLALCTGAAVVIVMAVYYWFSSSGTRRSTAQQLGELAKRVLPYLLVTVFVSALPNETIFDNVNPHRSDHSYRALLLQALEQPDDVSLQDSLESYRKKHFRHDDQRSPGDR